MNKRTMMVLLLAVVACGGQPAASQELTEADHAGIGEYFDALTASLTPEDNRVWVELHTEDAAILVPNTHIQGRDALYEWGVNESDVALSVVFSDFVIRGSGDIAWVTNRALFEIEGGDEGDYYVLTVLRRGADGTWRAEAWASVPR